jgi:hypothetical protein
LLIGALRRGAALSDKVPVTPTGDKDALSSTSYLRLIFCLLFVGILAGIGFFYEPVSVRLSHIVP